MPPSRKRYFSLMPEEEFISKTSEYLNDYFKLMHYADDKPILLEQLFTFSNPLAGMELFKSAKCILVIRDPRDVYAMSKYHKGEKAPSRFMPANDRVETFVEYYKCLYEGLTSNENVLIVSFEDLVYETDKIKKQISDFLNLKERNNFGNHFHPEISINNTAYYKKVKGIQNEIDYIEKELRPFLNQHIN